MGKNFGILVFWDGQFFGFLQTTLHEFSYCTLRLLVWILFLGFGLTGCAGMSGGTVGRAWTVNGKCEAILNWAKAIVKEFPLKSIGP